MCETNKNWEDFANAVVLQAVADYKSAIKTLKKEIKQGLTPKQRSYQLLKKERARYTIEEVKNFFLSEHFNTFTELDGRALLQQIEKECS